MSIAVYRRMFLGAAAVVLAAAPVVVFFEGLEWSDAVGRDWVASSDFQLDSSSGRGFWSVYAAVRELDSCPKLVIDRSVSVPPVHFLGFGRACEVVFADLPEMSGQFYAAPVVRGGIREGRGDWSMALLDMSPPELFVYQFSGSIEFLDSRIAGIPQTARDSGFSRRETKFSGPLAGIIEGALFFAILLVGGLFVPQSAEKGLLRQIVSFLAGLGVIAGTGLLFPPSLSPIAIALTLGIASYAALVLSGNPSGWSRDDLPFLGLSAMSILSVAMWSRASGAVVIVHADNRQYLSAARALSEGKLSPSTVSLERGLGQQPIHSLGYTLSVEGMLSLGMVLFVVAIAWSLLMVAELSGQERFGRFAAIAAVAVVFASPQVMTLALAVNSHFLVALLLLLLVTQLGLTSTGPANGGWTEPAGCSPCAVSAVVALVVLRPEGTLLVGLALLGSLRASGSPSFALWRWLGLATIAWNGVLFQGHLQRGESPSLVVLAMLVLGAALVMVPTVLVLLPARAIRATPLIIGFALWAVTLTLLLGDFSDIRFLNAVIENVGKGAGLWGSAGVLLFLLGLLVVALPQRKPDGPGVHGARWVIIGLLPLSLLAKLGDGLQRPDSELSRLLRGGGRVGWSDSVNRMWTHAILLVLLLVIVRFAQGRAGEEESDDDQEGAGQEREA